MTELDKRIAEMEGRAEEHQKKSRRLERIMMAFFISALVFCFAMLGYVIADGTGPEVVSEAGLISSLYDSDNGSWKCQYRTKDGDTALWFPGQCPVVIRVIYTRGRFSGSPGNVRLSETGAK